MVTIECYCLIHRHVILSWQDLADGSTWRIAGSFQHTDAVVFQIRFSLGQNTNMRLSDTFINIMLPENTYNVVSGFSKAYDSKQSCSLLPTPIRCRCIQFQPLVLGFSVVRQYLHISVQQQPPMEIITGASALSCIVRISYMTRVFLFTGREVYILYYMYTIQICVQFSSESTLCTVRSPVLYRKYTCSTLPGSRTTRKTAVQ